jgi:hypothetical protein
MNLFAVTEVATHRVGDPKCPACLEDYPERCRCGGFVHAEAEATEDPDDVAAPATRCDQCGRSAEDLQEAR